MAYTPFSPIHSMVPLYSTTEPTIIAVRQPNPPTSSSSSKPPDWQTTIHVMERRLLPTLGY
ncbi:hypothetical protein L484_005837 [Morus notabilis]|uniref:Uncharacterized protein n=1 Tax=Morus notabilis TaxID=981085 RepID=W9QQA1_9ROSA|nr:hypothetical protein L484_005837 [Morus notabilis]